MLAVAVMGVLAREAPGEFKQLALARKDRAGGLKLAHDLRILPCGWPHLRKERGSGKRRQPSHIEKVLEQVRDSAQRAADRRGGKAGLERSLVQKNRQRGTALRDGEMRLRPAPNLAGRGLGRKLLPFAKRHGLRSLGRIGQIANRARDTLRPHLPTILDLSN